MSAAQKHSKASVSSLESHFGSLNSLLSALGVKRRKCSIDWGNKTLNRPRCVVGNFSPSQPLCFVVSSDKAVLSTMFFEMSDGLDLQHYENSKSLRPVISFVIDACECVDVVAHLSRDWSCAWSDNTFALIPRHKTLLNFWITDVHVINARCKQSWVMWEQSHAANHRIWIFCRIFCSRGG